MKASTRIFLVFILVLAVPQLSLGMVLYGNGGNLPLIGEKVTVTIDNQVALTRMEQTFNNTTNSTVEVQYRFPLGEKASVQEFGLTGPDGRRQAGSIEEKQEAQTIYNNAQAQGATPAIAQTGDMNNFETKIGTVLPRSKSTVDLTYSEILSYRNGTIFYSVPLNVKRLQDNSLDMTSVVIELKDQKEIVKVTSPSHQISSRKIDGHHWQITFEKANFLPDADFQIAYEVKAQRMGMNFLSTQPNDKEAGSFLMLLAPQEIVDAADISARDIVFVMDISGSMAGYKIEQTKAAFNFFIEHLNARDRFNILAFDDRVMPFTTGLVEASDVQKSQAKTFISNLGPSGSTNIDEAMTAARAQFTDSKSTKAIIFLTDGLPTAGRTDINTIASRVKNANSLKIRNFVFGVGEDVSVSLLDKLALENRGEALYVHQNEDLKGKLTSFFETISKPLLVDLTIDWGGMAVSEVYPRQLPNIYKGSQLTIMGRYSGSGPKTVLVSGDLNGQKVTYPVEVNFVKNNSDYRFVARVWAKAKADDLIQEMRVNGENPSQKAEVIQLSKTFQFVTPYTSFVAVAPERVAAANPVLDQFRTAMVQPNPSFANQPIPVSNSAVSQVPVNFTPIAQPGQPPVTVIQTTQAKPISFWGANGFFPAAALLVPNFKKAREQARGKSCMANMRVLLGAIEMFNMDHPTNMVPTNVLIPDALISQGYLKQMPVCPMSGAGPYEYIQKAGTTDPTIGEVRCSNHNTVDNPYFGKDSPHASNVKVQVVTPWTVELWNNGGAQAVEWLINIPLFIFGLYLSFVLFIRTPLQVLSGAFNLFDGGKK